MNCYVVTLYFSPDDHRAPVEIEESSPLTAARRTWLNTNPSHSSWACALVEGGGVSERVAIEPGWPARVTSIGSYTPKPLSEREAAMRPGLLVRSQLEPCLAHLRPQPRCTIYVWPTPELYRPDTQHLGTLGDVWAEVIEVCDVVRDFAAEDPSQWNLGAQTYRHALVTSVDGRQGWVSTDRLEVAGRSATVSY